RSQYSSGGFSNVHMVPSSVPVSWTRSAARTSAGSGASTGSGRGAGAAAAGGGAGAGAGGGDAAGEQAARPRRATEERDQRSSVGMRSSWRIGGRAAGTTLLPRCRSRTGDAAFPHTPADGRAGDPGSAGARRGGLRAPAPLRAPRAHAEEPASVWDAGSRAFTRSPV